MSNINGIVVDTPEGKVYSTAYGEPYDNYYHDLYNDLFYKDIIFKDKSAGFYVEIGGLDGVVNSQSFIFEKVLGWDGIIVEPNPYWKEILPTTRKCNISNSAVSNTNGTALFECRSIYGFSGLKSNTSDMRYSDIMNEVKVKTITLCNLLDSFNAPNIVDWVSIDTEGAEIDILNQFFLENTKYRINLLNFETHQFIDADKILNNQPFLKIKNPYLDFIKISDNGLLKFNPIIGQLYRTPFVDNPYEGTNYKNVEYEHYYIHMDYLKENLHLKKFLI